MSPQSHRLPAPTGSLIDRDRTVAFTFEGREIEGHAGDTIASALAANGVWLLGRSFKYHRPRGLVSASGDDGNTLVQLDDEPNALADMVPIREGLAVRGQHYVGSLEHDRAAWIERFARFLPVGFYYKAFYKPRGIWNRWEPYVRTRAGLGRVNLATAHGYYDKAYAFADVAVIGAGPGGIDAQLQETRAGSDFNLIERMPAPGGWSSYGRGEVDGAPTRGDLQDLRDDLGRVRGLTLLTDAEGAGLFADNWLAVVQGNRLIKLRAGAVVVATGGIEQPLVFRNNDLPGVVLASAAQRLIRHYGVQPGHRAVIATANADGYAAALDLHEAGVAVAAIVDLRNRPEADPRAQAAADYGIRILTGHAVREAAADARGLHLGEAVIGRLDADGTVSESGERIDCDLLCMAVGTAPAAALLHHAGARFAYEAAAGVPLPVALPANVFAAGLVAGHHATAEASGRRAGWLAACAAGFERGAEPPEVAPDAAQHPAHSWPIVRHPKGKAFVDFDEDLTIADIENCIAEGFDDIELVKRYSTVGMGPSQGRLSNLNTIRLVAQTTKRPAIEIGATTTRPPTRPEKLGVLAGRGFEPTRLTAMHHRHVEAGAKMMPAGLWWRPAYYGAAAGRAAAIRAEALAVRIGVGLIDVSTLGKLEVRGPDAALFLERMYTFAYARQQVGRSRYVLLCDQTGAIADDGVACRIAENHFYVTATTSGVDAVYRQMLWWNAQWRLDVDVTNVTGAYAGVNIAGPESRAVLAPLVDGVDMGGEAFPYMGVRQGTVAGIPARLLRVGFVGELGYEVHVPASYGEALWDALMQAGADAGIRAFGVEAQRLLRLEKGHIIIGQDTDGLTHPHEADMAWAISRRKPFFVGGRAIAVQTARPLTRKLVGFTLPPDSPLPEECHLTVRGAAIVGRVTSIAPSPTLGHPIGLAFVAPDQAEPGRRFEIKLGDGRRIDATVAKLPFYDPETKRQEL